MTLVRSSVLALGRAATTTLAMVGLLTLSAPTSLHAQEAPRVVSLGGSVTETVFALGAEDVLVGVDQSSVYPARASELPDVGYFRTLSTEGVLSLEPDLVLAAEESGPAHVLEQIRSAGVRVVTIPSEESPEGARTKIRTVAAELDRVESGESLLARLDADLDLVAELLSGLESRPRVLFVWGRGSHVMQVSGSDTAAQSMLELAGADNAIDGFSGYRALTPEAAVEARPDVIVIDTGTLERLGGVDALLEDPPLASTPAGPAKRVVAVDILGLIGFGPRTGRILLGLLQDLHPELATR